MVETGSLIASIIAVAGAGFRLSLILNAVGAEIADTDVEIQTIARGISSFSLMLKQVGINIQTTRTLASQSAIDTANQIAKQSQSVFDEVKRMVEMVQKKDEKGNIQSISIAQRVTWCFKKQRIQYMLGQLECLKLSLSLMLQVLQLGKIIASEREDPPKQPLSGHEMLQERAEIQNMVVVRHWSLVDLRRLYQHAEHEDVDTVERPLPIHNGITPAEADPRLQIEPVQDETDPSTAMVKYQETPLSHLDASMNKAMYLPNRLLHAPDDNIVDHLLDEWTRLRELHPRSPRRENKYRSRYDSDDDSSDTNFERSEGIGGKYIEGPKSRKNVRFRARVESDSDDSDKNRHRRKATSRHVLHSDEDTDSSSSSPPPRSARRNSEGNGTRRGPNPQETPNEHNRRPYISPYTPSPRDGVPKPQPNRPSSRDGPPPSRPMPMQMPSQNWQNQHQPASPGLRPPPYNPAFPPQQMPSGGHYMPPPPGYGTSPQAPRNYTPQPQGLAVPYNNNNNNNNSHRKRSPRRDKPKKSQSGSSFKETAKKDVKRGLLGAGAVAGLMDILEGLGTI